MLTVGLTGGISAGKSAVAALFAELGGPAVAIIDADVLAREVVEPGSPGLGEVVAAFGPEILRPDATLDRAALAARVFDDPAARRRLEAITHPRIGELTVRRFDEASRAGARVVVHEVPLLVEAGMAPAYDEVVVVEAPLAVRLSRLAARGLPEAEARARIASQADDATRRAVATRVLDNSGEPAALAAQVGALWQVFADRR